MVYLWIGFVAAVLALIALDLFVFHRRDEVMTVRKALKWSAFWVALALAFNVAVGFMYAGHWLGLGTKPTALHKDGVDGLEAAALFFTGYVVEQSLSVDNLFVISVIFGFFKIPAKFQHRVLFWGILGVLLMRGAMIGLGSALVARFNWILYVFGAFLLYTAYKMLAGGGGGEADLTNNRVLRLVRRAFPVTHEFHGHHFVVPASRLDDPAAAGARPAAGTAAAAAALPAPAGDAGSGGVPGGGVRTAKFMKRWALTPLALALIVVETTDLIFAVDSIPAIFGITDDPFLVFTSNVCAVLGLRSLYFALAGMLTKFTYLQVSLAAVLGLVGAKMLASHWLHDVPGINFIMLGLVAVILAVGVIASVAKGRRETAAAGAARPL